MSDMHCHSRNQPVFAGVKPNPVPASEDSVTQIKLFYFL